MLLPTPKLKIFSQLILLFLTCNIPFEENCPKDKVLDLRIAERSFHGHSFGFVVVVFVELFCFENIAYDDHLEEPLSKEVVSII